MNCFYFWLTKSSKSHGPGKIVLKIFVSSLNPQPPPSPVRIFNVLPLNFLNANFDGPEVYCCAVWAACNIMILPRISSACYSQRFRASEESVAATSMRKRLSSTARNLPSLVSRLVSGIQPLPFIPPQKACRGARRGEASARGV